MGVSAAQVTGRCPGSSASEWKQYAQAEAKANALISQQIETQPSTLGCDLYHACVVDDLRTLSSTAFNPCHRRWRQIWKRMSHPPPLKRKWNTNKQQYIYMLNKEWKYWEYCMCSKTGAEQCDSIREPQTNPSPTRRTTSDNTPVNLPQTSAAVDNGHAQRVLALLSIWMCSDSKKTWILKRGIDLFWITSQRDSSAASNT